MRERDPVFISSLSLFISVARGNTRMSPRGVIASNEYGVILPEEYSYNVWSHPKCFMCRPPHPPPHPRTDVKSDGAGELDHGDPLGVRRRAGAPPPPRGHGAPAAHGGPQAGAEDRHGREDEEDGGHAAVHRHRRQEEEDHRGAGNRPPPRKCHDRPSAAAYRR